MKESETNLDSDDEQAQLDRQDDGPVEDFGNDWAGSGAHRALIAELRHLIVGCTGQEEKEERSYRLTRSHRSFFSGWSSTLSEVSTNIYSLICPLASDLVLDAVWVAIVFVSPLFDAGGLEALTIWRFL